MKKLFIMMLAGLLFACSSKVSLNNCYNEKTVDNDLASLVKQGLVTDEEASLIKDYASSYGYSIYDSVTYESLFTSAKAEKDKENRNKEIQKELDKAMSICFVKKYFTSDWQDQYITFDLKATNNTDKKINGFQFYVDIKDGAGNTLEEGSWNVAGSPVKAKASTVINRIVITYDHSDALAKLKAAELDKLQIEYHVSSIIYDDGTSLEIEE